LQTNEQTGHFANIEIPDLTSSCPKRCTTSLDHASEVLQHCKIEAVTANLE